MDEYNSDYMSWEEWLQSAAPAALIFEAYRLKMHYQQGELYLDFARDLQGDIDKALREYNHWLPDWMYA